MARGASSGHLLLWTLLSRGLWGVLASILASGRPCGIIWAKEKPPRRPRTSWFRNDAGSAAWRGFGIAVDNLGASNMFLACNVASLRRPPAIISTNHAHIIYHTVDMYTPF